MHYITCKKVLILIEFLLHNGLKHVLILRFKTFVFYQEKSQPGAKIYFLLALLKAFVYLGKTYSSDYKL